MDGACSCSNKIRPYVRGFPLGCWDHSTFSVSVVRAAWCKETLMCVWWRCWCFWNMNVFTMWGYFNNVKLIEPETSWLHNNMGKTFKTVNNCLDHLFGIHMSYCTMPPSPTLKHSLWQTFLPYFSIQVFTIKNSHTFRI
jgi:hypothetical protein